MDSTIWVQVSRECMNILAGMRADIAKEYDAGKKRKSIIEQTSVDINTLFYSCSYPCQKGRQACSSQPYTIIGC